jgi:hypothetical protein
MAGEVDIDNDDIEGVMNVRFQQFPLTFLRLAIHFRVFGSFGSTTNLTWEAFPL